MASGAGAGAEVGDGTVGMDAADGPDSTGDDSAGGDSADDDSAGAAGGADWAGDDGAGEAAADIGVEDAGCDDAGAEEAAADTGLDALGEPLEVQAPIPNAATAASAVQAATRRRVIRAA